MENVFVQLNLFDFTGRKEDKPGDFISSDRIGKSLKFQDLSQGDLVIADFSNLTAKILMAVKVQEIRKFPDGDEDLIYNDGHEWMGCIHKKDYINPKNRWGTKLYAFS